ncbi:MAG: ankyrin repeat domain-containing protein, partial [Puniceicoccales bacterium]|nr:ankyrin repeat domain-containing protein [Puniceicoccales bacterium]
MKSNELKFSYSLLLGILTAPALFSGDTFSDFQENALLGNDSAAEDSQDVQGDDFAEDNSLKNALPGNDFVGETTPGDDSPEEALSEEEDLPIEDQTPSFDRDEMIRELFKLVKNGDVEKTGEFFKSQEENIDINEKNDLGNTLLHVAIDRDNEEMIKFLIDRGADAHVKNNHGQTPLDFAIIHRKRGTINLLKRASAPKADEAETQSAEEKPEEA